MKINLIIYLVLVSFYLLKAQNDTLKMNLQECVDYAIKNSKTIQNASLDEQIANAKVGEIRAIGLPQVSGSVGVQHNLKLRDIFLNPTVPNVFGTPIPNNAVGKDLRVANFFQLPNSIDASLTVSQLLFSGSYVVGLQTAKIYKELSQKSKQKSLIQTKADVTKAYYMALINLERANLFQVNIGRVDSILKQTKALNKQGMVESIDIDRLEVTLNNLITERDKFMNMMLLSNVLLKYQMGMPLDKNIVLMDDLKSVSIDESTIKSEKINYTERVEYQQLQTAKRLQEMDLKNNRWSAFPTIAASLNVGAFTSAKNFGDVFSGNNYFALGGTNSRWANYGLIQLGMTVPIFGGFSKGYKTQQSKLNIKKADNNIQNFEQVVDLQAKQTELMLRNNIKSLQMQERNMKLAQNVSIVTQKKYKQGTGSNLEVITAESSLKEAQINYYNTLFDAITSKVDYDLAVGNIK